MKKLKKKLRQMEEKIRKIQSSESSESGSTYSSDESTDSESSEKEANNQRENRKEIEVEEPKQDFSVPSSIPKLKYEIGKPFHDEIVVRWNTYLHKGLDKKQREDLMEKYKLPINCKMLLPPQVNKEILPYLPKSTSEHDRFLMVLQQLAHGLAAIEAVKNEKLEENKFRIQENNLATNQLPGPSGTQQSRHLNYQRPKYKGRIKEEKREERKSTPTRYKAPMKERRYQRWK
ncbi:hypothetical protein JTB14_008118 [Gonioctena quinquepunctata]|nr:hypothetical protein JTB14_008118 [Gonioctena quinquepunctata]